MTDIQRDKRTICILLVLIAVLFAIFAFGFTAYASWDGEVRTEQNELAMMPVNDAEYVEPPVQDVSDELVQAIDGETEREWTADYIWEEAEPEVETSSHADPSSFRSIGVVYDDTGYSYTWYSQNVLPGGGLTELNANGRHVDDRDFVCDGDGYISVASDDYPIGTIIETPFGEAKVYDTGSGSGNIDIYTNY